MTESVLNIVNNGRRIIVQFLKTRQPHGCKWRTSVLFENLIQLNVCELLKGFKKKVYGNRIELSSSVQRRTFIINILMTINYWRRFQCAFSISDITLSKNNSRKTIYLTYLFFIANETAGKNAIHCTYVFHRLYVYKHMKTVNISKRTKILPELIFPISTRLFELYVKNLKLFYENWNFTHFKPIYVFFSSHIRSIIFTVVWRFFSAHSVLMMFKMDKSFYFGKNRFFFFFFLHAEIMVNSCFLT